MGWKIYFWAIAALLVLPLPLKLAGYISGKDKSPKAVKVEEMANAAFFIVGLFGLYGSVYQVDVLTPLFWKGWVALAVALSIAGLFWSPKVKYGASVMGTSRVRAVIALGFLAFVPMLVAVWGAGA
jgi:hypothetical protein